MKPFPNRWWYGAPWKNTHPFRPMARIYRCGDEYCNDTLYLQFPLLGCITIRTGKNIRLSGRCEACVAEFGPWCEGCNDCHQGPRCHPWWGECICKDTGHEGKLSTCPACGGAYCPECEEEPKGNCPQGGKP